jgi:hypothetical protein
MTEHFSVQICRSRSTRVKPRTDVPPPIVEMRTAMLEWFEPFRKLPDFLKSGYMSAAQDDAVFFSQALVSNHCFVVHLLRAPLREPSAEG